MNGKAHATTSVLFSALPLAVLAAFYPAVYGLIAGLLSGNLDGGDVYTWLPLVLYLAGVIAGSQMPDMDIFYGKNVVVETFEGILKLFATIGKLLKIWSSKRRSELSILAATGDRFRSALWSVFAPLNFVYVLLAKLIVAALPAQWVYTDKSKLRWQHRTYTHSLVTGFSITLAATAAAAVFAPHPWEWLGYGVASGWIGHLLGDMSTVSGVMLFWPVSRRSYRIAPDGAALNMSWFNPSARHCAEYRGEKPRRGQKPRECSAKEKRALRRRASSRQTMWSLLIGGGAAATGYALFYLLQILRSA